MTFTSGPVVAAAGRGGADGKVPLGGAEGKPEMGNLFCIKLGKGSLFNTKGGTGGRPEGRVDPSKDEEVLLTEPVEVTEVGNNGDE